MFSLGDHTLFATLAGSQAHGTAGEGSDVDLRGVCVAPRAVRLSLSKDFEQYDGELPDDLAQRVMPALRAHPTASKGLSVKAECVVFDVAKFLKLCAVANPNALEILFADPADWLFDTPTWQLLYRRRHQFLTQKVQQTFLGYAMSQLKRIRTHRGWLLQPPPEKPTRGAFGLPDASTLSRDNQNRMEQGIAEKLRSYGLDSLDMPKPTRIALKERFESFWMDVLSVSEDALEAHMRAVATHALHLPEEVAATLNAEKRYRAAMRQWESYQNWAAHRNRARADLERKHGYDTKHAMHLIRLMRMGLEVLKGKELLVRRPDAEELRAIRDGALAFEEVLDQAERLREQMIVAAQVCDLPEDVEREALDGLLLEVIDAGRGLWRRH